MKIVLNLYKRLYNIYNKLGWGLCYLGLVPAMGAAKKTKKARLGAALLGLGAGYGGC